MEEENGSAEKRDTSDTSSNSLIEFGQPGYLDDRPSTFQKLPKEVRLMIWKFAIPTSTSKLITLDTSETSSHIGPSPLAWNNLFGICQESRQVAQKALEAEKKQHRNFSMQGAVDSIDFEHDIFRILKSDWLDHLEHKSVLDTTRFARRLIVPLTLFNAFKWYTMHAPLPVPPSQRHKLSRTPNPFVLHNCFWLLNHNFTRVHSMFCHVRELIVIVNEEDELFRDIMRTIALQASDPAIYQKLRRFSRRENHRFLEKMQPFVRSEDWQHDYAAKILEGMRASVRTSLQRANPRWGKLNWERAKTPLLSVWYPGKSAKVVMTDRGDLDHGGEFKKNGKGKPWATFKWPTVKLEYPTGHVMEKVSCAVVEPDSGGST